MNNIAIKVEKLSKSYSGNKVLNNLSFTVKKGKVFGILGANGAGKSTSIECILGIQKADEGFVEILGMNPINKGILFYAFLWMVSCFILYIKYRNACWGYSKKYKECINNCFNFIFPNARIFRSYTSI